MKLLSIIFLSLFLFNCEKNTKQKKDVLLPEIVLNEKDIIIGKQAPSLKIEKWVKGDSTELFLEDKVYLIDFWATWCGPCIQSIPHLSKLQKKYKGDLIVIGVTNEDKYGNSLVVVKEFVNAKDSLIQYNIVWSSPSTPEGNMEGIFLHDWMRLAKTKNLPQVFIVDRNGKFAYVGETTTIDKPLKDIIDNEYDIDNQKKLYAHNIFAKEQYNIFKEKLKTKEFDKALAIATTITTNNNIINPRILSGISARVSENDSLINEKWINLSLNAALKSVKISNFSDGIKALSNVSLTIPTGMFGLLGPNGAGKSSLMRTIATLQDATSGEITFNNIDVLKEKMALKKTLGYLPQDFGFYKKENAKNDKK